MSASNRRAIITTVLSVVGILVCYVPFLPGPYRDFLGLYAAGRLLPHDIYNVEAVYRIHREVTGMIGPSLLYTRLPFVAILVWPLSLLSYPTALTVWLTLRIAAIVAFVVIWPRPQLAMLLSSWWLPISIALWNGQDSVFLLLWIAIVVRIWDCHPFLAGLALSLCLAKFHLFLLLPVFLLSKGRRLLPGAIAGATALLAVSFIVVGAHWPVDYAAILRNPVINPDRAHSPNIHGLGLSFVAELVVTACAAALSIAAILRATFPIAFAVTLAAGVLFSYHAAWPDLVVVLPAALLFIEAAQTRHSGSRTSASLDSRSATTPSRKP